MSDAAGDDVALAELQQRLETFTEQLASIHQLLESDPENAEFLNIAQDLVEVIRLTKEMIDLKLSNANSAAAGAAVEPTTTAAVAAPEDGDAFAAGAVCEALSKGVWFPAVVESLTARDTYNVHYIGFGNQDELPAASLRRIEVAEDADALPPRGAIAVGFRCRAKYYVDAQYYAAQVTALTAHGFQVLFDGYGNSEEVPYEYLRPADATAPAAVEAVDETSTVTTTQRPVAVTAAVQAAAARAAAAAAAASASLKPRDAVVAKAIKVPENLQVLPTDSEAEKERKRKRLKHIQKLNKQIEVDNAHNLKQHDWKSFQHKAVKGGKVKGSGALSKRGSMFASPDSVQGRVGVVGSGQGMTHYDPVAKKIKKSHLESAPRL